jgi:exopolysaccharide biosynthesis polyprenyl glycosylphosphotransferase
VREVHPLAKGTARPGIRSPWALMLSDALAGVVALAAVLIAAGESVEPIIIAAAPLMVLSSRAGGLYRREQLVICKSTLDEAPALFQISGLFALVAWLVHGHAAMLAPSQVGLLWGAALLLLLAGRAVARAAGGQLARADRCLVIGDPSSVVTLSAKLEATAAKAEVVATLPLSDDDPPVDPLDLRETVQSRAIDRVIFGPTASDARELLDAIRATQQLGVRVSLAPQLFQVVGAGVEFEDIGGLTALGIRRFGLDRSSRVIKRVFDLVVCAIVIIVCAPLMAVIATAIALDSPGPVLFRQRRVGRDGRHFEILKFRSMVEDAEDRKSTLADLNLAQGLFKIADDPRITRCGRVLRRFCMDELPQLFNVWRGDMSLVGPRPLVVDEDALIVGMDRGRLHLRPGMTGHWQVLGSTRIPLHEMVVIDYLYVTNWSLWTDVKLLLRTVPRVLSRTGI